MTEKAFEMAKNSLVIEQKAVADVLETLDRASFEKAVEALSACRQVITSASGSSGIAAKKFSHTPVSYTHLVGLTAHADVTVAVQEDSFIVPYDAVEEDAKGREFVYVFANGEPQKRVIETQAELPDGFLVKEGLADGEVLVLTPQRVTARAVYTAEERTHA